MDTNKNIFVVSAIIITIAIIFIGSSATISYLDSSSLDNKTITLNGSLNYYNISIGNGSTNISGLVPYTGASSNVNLNGKNITNITRLGIGTTAPSAPFHSVGTSFPTAIFELVNAGSGGTSSAFNLYRNQSSPLANDGTGIVFSFNNGAGAKTIFARLTAIATSVTSGAETSAMTFDLGTTLAEKMRITSAGNVGIGTTTPSQTLDVRGSINQTNGSIYINNLYGELWFDNDSTQLLSIPVNNTWYNISFNLSIDNGNSTNGFTIHNGTSLVCTHSGLYDFRYSVSMETTGTNKEYNIAITNGTDYYHNTETHTKLGTIGDVVTISDGGYIRCNPNVKLSLAVRQVSGTNDVNIHQAHLNAIRIGN